MPTVRQLEYFVAVADLRHFGKAADACHVSQPTLSHQLKTLEQRIGAQLIERGGAGVQLTPVGRDIAERARRVIVEVRDIRAIARRSQDSLAGIVRFGVTPTLGPYLMPGIVAALHREQPDLRLYIREGIPANQALDLGLGRLDMLLGPLPIAGESLELEPLFRERMAIVVSPQHRLASYPVVTRADLAGECFLSMDPRHHYHHMVETICAELGGVILRDYEGTSLDSIRQMVGSGIGIAVLPELYIRSEVGGDAMVRRIDPVDWAASRSIAAAWRRNAAYADAYRAVAKKIQNAARAILE
ncbi:hydrogen peroxide-inducible genes activator [Sphingobium algorifonticola]|uniref:Hydrogen peroxide-inducible genes activator n=1 Tax=Sphingobium algorifonticola TaxID=2008318 RepID=A0A437JA20_9SPHN|nr:hydrogen peroxide-inducible genes activator [Sphingobium algorifonticola]RVT42324.1 hydrogen peroxide-inducible genes activator [Sphingobium algorifonticola]